MSLGEQRSLPTPKPLSDDSTRITIQCLAPEESGQCEEHELQIGRCELSAVFLVTLSEGTNRQRKLCARHVWVYGMQRRGITIG